jgi:hypothetical protein
MALRAAAARLASSSLRRRHSHLLPAALLSPDTTAGPTAFLHSHATSFGTPLPVLEQELKFNIEKDFLISLNNTPLAALSY